MSDNFKLNLIKNLTIIDQKKRLISINKIKDHFNNINKGIICNCLFYKDLSEKFLLKSKIKFNSSSSTIIKHPNFIDKYILNTRIINYKLDSIGKSNNSGKCITINKIFILDKLFNKISMKCLYPANYDSKYVGIEDIRLFSFKDEIYFIGSSFNTLTNKIHIVSNKYVLGENYNPIIINPTFKTSYNWEKNWVFFDNKGDINIIYKWNPIYICKIDYQKQQLNLIKTIENLPPIFNNFRGSTNGVKYDNKIWFIVHQQQNIVYDVKGYVHNFVVFDENMNLLGYSHSFNFENKVVEFCIGMEINIINKFVITYSTLDSSTKLAVFSPEYINSLINYI
jgi:hypothetical protein